MARKQFEFISFMDKELPAVQLPGQFFTRDRLSNNQVFGALTTFGRGVNPNNVIGLTDASEEYDGKNGILFSTSGMYFSDADFPSGQHSNAMILYRDIVNVYNSGKLINDCTTIEVKNLPFKYISIRDMTLNMDNFCMLIQKIMDWNSAGYEYENDRKTSLNCVKYYLEKRDAIMRQVISYIKNNTDIPKVYYSCMDGLGLTPLHYCLLLGNERMACKIAHESAKFYHDIYIDGQPEGLYNLCLLAAYKGYSSAFKYIYEGSSRMKPFMDRRKNAARKKGVVKAIDMGLNFIPGSNLFQLGADLVRNNLEKEEESYVQDDEEDVVSEQREVFGQLAEELPDKAHLFEDPRYEILWKLYNVPEELIKRTKLSKHIVCWNKRYITLTEEEMESDSTWNGLEVMEN